MILLKAWYALADACYCRAKENSSTNGVNFVWQKILNFAGIKDIFSGGASNAVPKFGGNGIGLNTPGGFFSTPASPIGSGC